MKITQFTSIEEINEYIKPYKSREHIELLCSRCETPFTTRKKDITDTITKFSKGERKSINLFCSRSCANLTTVEALGGGSKVIHCRTCGKSVRKPLSDIRKSNNNFCSKSCAATFNNSIYKRREPEGNCASCDKPISSSRKFCKACRAEGKDYRTYKVRVKIKGTYKVVNREYKKYKTAKERKKAGYIRTTLLRQERKSEYIRYLGGKCSRCGYTKSTWSIEFHHVDPSTKELTIAHAISTNTARDKVLKELDKCVLLCSNCHRLEHSKEKLSASQLKRHESKLRAVAYLGGSCVSCGLQTNDVNVFDFHHKDPSDKEVGVARILTHAWETIRQELDKCVLLCANCHGEHHEQEYLSNRRIPESNW